MKKYILPLLLFVLLAMQSCVRCGTTGGSFKRLPVEEFKAFIASPDVQLVDVRTAEEYAAGHIEGSVNIDVMKGHEELATVLDPEQSILDKGDSYLYLPPETNRMMDNLFLEVRISGQQTDEEEDGTSALPVILTLSGLGAAAIFLFLPKRKKK